MIEQPLEQHALDGLSPILDQTEANKEFDATFQKDCGKDEVCQSQLEVFVTTQLKKTENSNGNNNRN